MKFNSSELNINGNSTDPDLDTILNHELAKLKLQRFVEEQSCTDHTVGPVRFSY